MQAPRGFSGVQTFPNRGHSRGDRAPVSTSAQEQPGSKPTSPVSSAPPASNRAYSFRSAMPEPRISPMPRHAASHGSKYFRTLSCAVSFPFAVTAEGFEVLTLRKDEVIPD